MKNQLVFIGGFPSGGTDLLKNILNAHEEIYINGEMPFLYRLSDYQIPVDFRIDTREKFDKLKGAVNKYDIWDNLENLSNTNFEDFKSTDKTIKDFFRVSFSKKGKKVWGNKTPQNTENIDILSKYFPESKFIIITRDIRDIALSWKKKWGKSILLTSHKWNARMQVNVKGNRILLVKYEDLLENIEAETKRICDFLGIPWDDSMIRFQDKTTSIIDGKINYGKGLIPENKEKWKKELSKKTLKRIEEIAYTALEHHDYPISIAKTSKEIRWHENLYGLLEDVLAMIFVGNRASANNTFITRFKMIINQIRIRF